MFNKLITQGLIQYILYHKESECIDKYVLIPRLQYKKELHAVNERSVEGTATKRSITQRLCHLR